jgi:predicted amidohydrolase
MTFKAACLQMTATPDVAHDLATLARLTADAVRQGAQFVAAPEYCAGLDTKDGKVFPVAFPEAQHPALPALQALAQQHGIWFLAGSIGVTAEDGRVRNRSFMLRPDGAIAARYDKIHLFDIDLGDGHSYRESATVAPGAEAAVSDCVEGTIGLSICYDLRFAALYRTYGQAGVDMLAIPAAFTKVTGQAHWHTLIRARAIENGAFVIAPGQCGTLAGGAECFGHSLIVDPWGRVLADGGESEGVIVAEIDRAKVAETRGRIPSLRHGRDFQLA